MRNQNSFHEAVFFFFNTFLLSGLQYDIDSILGDDITLLSKNKKRLSQTYASDLIGAFFN